MDYLQYQNKNYIGGFKNDDSFKPYYKWITFNTEECPQSPRRAGELCFKPYYKWITFNTLPVMIVGEDDLDEVLNLIINGLPSILSGDTVIYALDNVLNLIINGLPSIHRKVVYVNFVNVRFKPYYKWITFNTHPFELHLLSLKVLNLIINGLPSILKNIRSDLDV